MASRQLVASFKTQFARVNGIHLSAKGALSSSAASYSSPLLTGNISVALNSAVAAGRGNNSNNASLNFVRYATKRAAGSKTSNKDSAGRRLGSKKADGEEVHVGEIIYRQRGTKIYPGENVGIGTDHTLFALEKGWVRFYYDPFHPKRKFAGIVLTKEHRLPSPHFAPTARRFGRTELIDEDEAAKELSYLPQKERNILPKVQEALQKREAQRNEKISQIRSSLQEIAPQVCASEAEAEIASQYLSSLRKFLNSGRTLQDAQHFAAREYKIDTTIEKNAGRITEEECATKIAEFSSLVEKVNGAVTFGPRFNLIKLQTEEELKADRLEKVKQMEAIYKEGPVVKDRREKIKKLIDSDCFPMGYRFDLRKRFLKTIKPENEHQEYLKEKKLDNISANEMAALAKKKKGTIIRKWNYDLRKTESIFVPKN